MSRSVLSRLTAWTLLLAAGAAQAAPGFLVVAPDRGFTGNERVRDAFAEFADAQRAALVFVTPEGTTDRLDRALATLDEQNAEPVVLLPFYLSAAHPDMTVIRTWLDSEDVMQGRPFGRSSQAPAALQAALLSIDEPSATRLTVVGHGARTDTEAKQMESDLRKLLDTAARGIGFASAQAVVWPDANGFDRAAFEQRLTALSGPGNPHRDVVLPFHLGPDLDAMMGFTPRLQGAAPEGMNVLDAGAAMQPAMSLWLAREAARHRTLQPEEIGVVVHAHGSTWQWNETMRQGAAPLTEEFPVEFAFSMGDPATLEHAVRHLEERGAKAVVILRVFGMASSFRDGIVRFIGQAWETCEAPQAMHGHHGGHGSGSAPSPLLRTALPVVTVGGLEDHPLYAEALYERALAISEAPERETLILVAHGVGTEQGNAHWRDVLESIRGQMLDMGGDRFRDIEVGLWSEDWPELRQSAVQHVRSLVETGNEDNGRVLIVPARTLGQGPADEYLDGLDYVLGEGFSPHPLFAEWLRGQVKIGVEQLAYEPGTQWGCDSG